MQPLRRTPIEKGHITPKISRLESIAKILHCSVPALFRHYSESQADQASIIFDALAGLPEDAQNSIIDLVLQASRVMHGQVKE